MPANRRWISAARPEAAYGSAGAGVDEVDGDLTVLHIVL
jgi:hypothetical protein